MFVVPVEREADTTLKASNNEIAQDYYFGYLVIVCRDSVLADRLTGLVDAGRTGALSDKGALES